MFDVRVCEECKKDIGPDDAFVEIDIASDSPEEPLLAVRLHPADCLTKVSTEASSSAGEVTRVKRKKQK